MGERLQDIVGSERSEPVHLVLMTRAGGRLQVTVQSLSTALTDSLSHSMHSVFPRALLAEEVPVVPVGYYR